MHKYILISFFSVVTFSAANGQQKNHVYDDTVTTIVDAQDSYDYNNEKIRDTIYIDTTLYYKQPALSPDSVTAWKNLKDFAYVKKLDSLLKAAKENQHKPEPEPEPKQGNNWLAKIFSLKGVQFFLWSLAILFVLFLLYKLFLTDGVFRKKTTVAKSAAPTVEEETIKNESDLEILIKQAIQNGNYRLAVRYQYLQTLYKLAAKKLVELAADKTNNQYVREIANKNYQNDFAALTLNYEYVWYGEFIIEENIYKKIAAGFSQFNSKL